LELTVYAYSALSTVTAVALRFSGTSEINVRHARLTASEFGKYAYTSGSSMTVLSLAT